MKKMLVTLTALGLFGLGVVLGGDTPAAAHAKALPEKKEAVSTPAPAAPQGQPGVRYQDANQNGICDNYENGTPQGRMHRGGGGQSGAAGCGHRQGFRRGRGDLSGNGAGAAGRGGQGQQRRLRDGSCLTR